MAEKKNAKITALVTTLICIILAFVDVSWEQVGLYAGCGMQGRLLYSFFHASIVHAALNAWCLLCIVFIYDVSVWRLLLGYLCAATFPVDTLAGVLGSFDMPTVGLSGIVFFLFASLTFEVKRRWYYQGWMAFYLVIGFLFPQTNAWLHLYCYMLGLMYALLNKPIVR